MEQAMNLLCLALLIAQVGSGAAKEPARDYTITIGPKLPSYRFHFVWDEDPNYKVVNALQVFKGESDEPVQVLDECEMTEPPQDPAAVDSWVKAEDLNFDGYPDLLMQNWAGATGNIGYCIWLFNPKIEKYVFSQSFSDRIGNYQIDAKTKTITTFNNSSAFVYQKQTYAVRNGNLILIAEEKQDASAGRCPYHLIHRVEKNGAMVIVGEKWQDGDQKPCTP